MKMNLPNKLTLLRVLHDSVFCVLSFYTDKLGYTGRIIALVSVLCSQLYGSIWTDISPESIIWSPTLESLWIRWRTSCWSARR